MPLPGKKGPTRRRGRGGISRSLIAEAKNLLDGSQGTDPQDPLFPGNPIACGGIRGRKRIITRPPLVPVRRRKQGAVCTHVCLALLDKGEEKYREVLEKFVIPSSKCLIPWDPKQSIRMFSCEGSQCHSTVEFVCCHCSQKLCRLHVKEHALQTFHGCAANVNGGHIACFCCGELIVQMDKCAKIWREHRICATYETALRHGWIPDISELDSCLPIELREACEKRHALVGVHGIVNLSNTCCLNVILQAFCHTPLFRDFCLARLHRCSPDALRFNNNNCVMCAFSAMIFDLYILPPGQCYAPQSIFQSVQNSLSDHGSELGEQEDPAEIINLLLNDMHLHSEHDGRKISEALSRKLHLYDRETASWCVAHSVYCSCIICDLFSGVEEYTTTCLECKQDRVQGNGFKLLMLPIREDKPAELGQPVKPADLSLEDCLKMYTDNQFISECKNVCCVDVRGAFRTNRFRHLPVVLIIQLKRAVAKTAKAKTRDGDLKKNRDHIQFPLELDMSPYMAAKHSGSTKYTLYGVVVHKGVKLSSGHYVCYIKHINGRWLCMDDRAVFCFSEAHVLTLQAYMLFYIHETVQFSLNPLVDIPPCVVEEPLTQVLEVREVVVPQHVVDSVAANGITAEEDVEQGNPEPEAENIFTFSIEDHVCNDHTYGKKASEEDENDLVEMASPMSEQSLNDRSDVRCSSVGSDLSRDG